MFFIARTRYSTHLKKPLASEDSMQFSEISLGESYIVPHLEPGELDSSSEPQHASSTQTVSPRKQEELGGRSPFRAAMARSAEHHTRRRDAPPQSPILLSLSNEAVKERKKLQIAGALVPPPPLEVPDLHPVVAQLSLKVSRELQLSEHPPQIVMDEMESSQTTSTSAASVEVVKEQPELLECSLCLDDKVRQEFVFLQCAHYFCKDCFKHFMDVETKKKVTDIRCPDVGCRQPVDKDTLEGQNSQAVKQLEKNIKQHRREMGAMTGRSRGFLCGKFILGTLRNLFCCGWFCPQDYGLGFICFICTCASFCCTCCCDCFCDCFCGLCSCCPCESDMCDFEMCCENYPCLNFTCFGNDIEVCPYCTSIIQYTGGCPNIHCSACRKHYVRDQQCNFPCYCCVYGFYVPLNYNVCCG